MGGQFGGCVMPAQHKRARGKSAPRGGWRVALAAVLVVQLTLAMAYALRLPLPPPDHAPDESAHRIYIAHLVTTKSFPVFNPSRGRDNPQYEFHQPPLFYLLAAPVFAVTGGGDKGLLAARLLVVLLGLVTTLATVALARTLFPDALALAVGAGAVVAFWPMHLNVSASVNNDELATAAWTVGLWLLASYLRHGRLAAAIAAGAVAGVALLAKTSTLFLVPLALAVIALRWARTTPTPWRRVIGHSAVFAGIVLAIGGWWLVRNWVLYGDPLAWGAFQEAFGWQTPERWFYARGFGVGEHWGAVAALTYPSFWGAFGLAENGMPAAYLPYALYGVLGLLVVPAVAGVIAVLRAPDQVGRRLGTMLVVAWAFVFVAFLRFNLEIFQPQGRYLLPLVPIVAVFVSAGCAHLGGRRAWALLPGGMLLFCALYGLALVVRL